jgi:hypothetical protein
MLVLYAGLGREMAADFDHRSCILSGAGQVYRLRLFDERKTVVYRYTTKDLKNLNFIFTI